RAPYRAKFQTSRPPSLQLASVLASPVEHPIPSAFALSLRRHARPRDPQRESLVRSQRPSRIWLGFLPPRVRTKTCPLFQSPVGAARIPRDCQREIVVRDRRPCRIWLGFLPPRLRTKTCPLFQSPVGAARIPRDCQREIVVRDRRSSHLWLGFLPPRVRTKTCPLFQSPVGAAHIPRDCQREIVVRDRRPCRIWLGFLPPRVRTKTCPLFQSPVGAARTPRDCQREIVVRNRRPCRIWLGFLSLQGANQNLSAFFLRKAGTSYPAMNPDAHTSDLFPDFSPVPQMVFVNDAVSLQIEADQRVILVHGVVYSHYSREDRTAEAYALVSLYESGYVD